MNVRFIGFGSMGAGLSRNLIEAGHDQIVYTAREAGPEYLLSLNKELHFAEAASCSVS
jgi:3-hydroxyisobutyrate dehydrogenase-like beta-hydroxyacid dehydrogenase